MRHEHFLRSLCEQARGNRKNSVMGLLKEGPQDHPLNPNNNRLNGYFNKPQQPSVPAGGEEQGGVVQPERTPQQRLADAKQDLARTIRLMLKYMPQINDPNEARSLEEFDVYMAEFLDDLGFKLPDDYYNQM